MSRWEINSFPKEKDVIEILNYDRERKSIEPIYKTNNVDILEVSSNILAYIGSEEGSLEKDYTTLFDLYLKGISVIKPFAINPNKTILYVENKQYTPLDKHLKKQYKICTETLFKLLDEILKLHSMGYTTNKIYIEDIFVDSAKNVYFISVNKFEKSDKEIILSDLGFLDDYFHYTSYKQPIELIRKYIESKGYTCK